MAERQGAFLAGNTKIYYWASKSGYNTPYMHILDSVSLANHSTMRLGGKAAHLAEVTSREQVAKAVDWANERQLPIIMIGQGSNIVWSDKGWPGLVLVNKIELFEVAEKNGMALVKIGGGEQWDQIVGQTVERGLHGIEALSLIPGTAGATPVQNVGAYGQEIADTLVDVEAYDSRTKSFVTIPKKDCQFAYRMSRFKTSDRGRFFITSLTLKLTHDNPKPPFYPSVQTYFDEHGIKSFTPQVLRDAVIAIRRAKLPDPANNPTNGSFFTNPIVSGSVYGKLKAKYPDIASWETKDGKFKLSAAWLIEAAGFKDVHDAETGMATWPRQALVLVNEHAKHTSDLLKFKQKIVDAVKDKFGVTLEQEPELIGE